MNAPALLNATDRKNPVIQALAECYRQSRAGRTGQGIRPFSIRYEKLAFDQAQADVGDERRARQILLRLEAVGILRLTRKPLAREKILSVFVVPEAEAQFFELIDEPSPREERNDRARIVAAHRDDLRAHPYEVAWSAMIDAALDDIHQGRNPDGLPAAALHCDETLRAAVAVSRNARPISLRRLSAESLHDSKLLGRRREAIERLLAQFLPPDLATLEAWQVADAPASVQICGPLGVELPDGTKAGEPSRLSPYTVTQESLAQATRVFTTAKRCLSIENLDTFRDMTATRSDVLFVHTSYPSDAVIRLLRALPASVQLLHWGDTDPWGFDILRVLRQRTDRKIHAFRMKYRPGPGPELSKREAAIMERLLTETSLLDIRAELLAMRTAGNKGLFEQESLPFESLS